MTEPALIQRPGNHTDRCAARPVFVVGMNGSGTSMLTESLGRHPGLYSFPGETRMIPHLMDVAHQYADLSDDSAFRELWELAYTASPDVLAFDTGNVVRIPDEWRAYRRDLATILDTLFSQFAGAAGKHRWCEKSPANTEHILRISRLFPGATFVHIIRDGRDCAASTQRRQHRTPELTIYRWRQIVRDAIGQGQALGERYLQVRYEDLTEHPDVWMPAICKHIDLPFNAVVLESAMPQSADAPTDSAKDSIGRIKPNSGKWREHFSDRELKRLESIGGMLLAELGYEVVFEPGERQPSWWTRKVQRFVDYFRANRRLRAKLAGDSDVSWGEIAHQFRASVREYRSKRF